jgi:AmmeMemoRadiSam system protein A
MSPTPSSAADQHLTDADRNQLLALARAAIENRIAGKQPNACLPQTAVLSEKRGAFVTLHVHGRLRGCIGTIHAHKPLYTTIHDMALAAAFHDPRFDPVRAVEIAHLEIEISVLTPLREVVRIDDIHIGTHGLLLMKGSLSGLLLPQVAAEQGWGRTEFLDHTCMKAGLPPGAWKDPEAKLYIFSADIFKDSPRKSM